MPAIVDLVSAISDDVIAKLAAAGYPALVDGKILLGSQHLAELSAAPRVVFVPTKSKFAPRDPTAKDLTSAEGRLMIQQRPIASEIVVFEVHCWGQSSTVDADYDITQALYQCIMMSLHDLCEGCYKVTDGKWTGSAGTATQLGRAGLEYVFGVEIATPVLDELLPYAPSVAHLVVVDATDDTGDPIEITTATPHGLANGVIVIITAVGGQTLANGTWPIASTGSLSFTIPVNGDGSHPYTIGGDVQTPAVSGAVVVALTDSAGHTVDTETVR
jgi:hypothetical protein